MHPADSLGTRAHPRCLSVPSRIAPRINRLSEPRRVRHRLPAIPQQGAEPAPARPPLLSQWTDLLGGDAPAAAKFEAFLARAPEATGGDDPATAGALVPWICDALLSNRSVKTYGSALMNVARNMQAQGVNPLHVTAGYVKLYKRAVL